MSKIYSDVIKLAKFIRRNHPGEKIVFTNGCFDIIHDGHIHMLREAAALGDILVVGLNTDESVRALKGPDRPVLDQDKRSLIVASIRYVDYVILFAEETPAEVLNVIRPDVLVKGAEYSVREIIGSNVAGETVRVPMVEGSSTTGIIERIRKIGS